MSWASAVTELTQPSHRKRLTYGVWTGYFVTAGLVALGLLFWKIELLSTTIDIIIYLAPLKLITNTWMWVALTRDRHVLLAATINQFADAILITGVIHFTGGSASPAISVYFIVLAITATLSNVRVMIMTAAAMLTSYTAMLVLIAAGVLQQHPTFLSAVYEQGRISPAFVVVDVLRVAFMLAILVAAMSSALQMIRDQQAQLEAQNAELAQASKLKSEFVANITHELRTPIHGVLGLTEMLEDGIYGTTTDRQNTALNNIRKSAENLLHIVDDLLSFERVNSARLSVRLQSFEVWDLLDQVKSYGEWMAGKKNLTFELTGTRVRLMECDPGILEHIVTNLMSNAIKFTPDGGTIRFDLSRHGHEAVIHVIDTGIGINKEDLEKIWEPFRQVDGSTSRQFGGVGLGLAVVAKLSPLINARIDVASTNEGTTFSVRVPGAMP